MAESALDVAGHGLADEADARASEVLKRVVLNDRIVRVCNREGRYLRRSTRTRAAAAGEDALLLGHVTIVRGAEPARVLECQAGDHQVLRLLRQRGERRPDLHQGTAVGRRHSGQRRRVGDRDRDHRADFSRRLPVSCVVVERIRGRVLIPFARLVEKVLSVVHILKVVRVAGLELRGDPVEHLDVLGSLLRKGELVRFDGASRRHARPFG
jgi:hypothetical protein